MKKIYLIALLLLFFLSVRSYCDGENSRMQGELPLSLRQGLLLYYNFNEGQNDIAYDKSGNNSNGTISGASWVSSFLPSYGNALYFDGTNEDSVIRVLTYSGAYTVSVNFKTDALNYYGNLINNLQGVGGCTFHLSVYLNQLQLSIGTGVSPFLFQDLISCKITTNVFYNVIVVATLTGFTVDVNGKQIASGAYSGIPLLCDATHDISIGMRQIVYHEYFKGIIDNVIIWTRGLSVAERQQVYSQSIGD